MSYGIVQVAQQKTNFNGGAAVSSETLAMAVTKGNTLAVIATWGSGGGVGTNSCATDADGPFTQSGITNPNQNDATHTQANTIYYKKNSNGGNLTITFTFTGITPNWVSLWGVEISGIPATANVVGVGNQQATPTTGTDATTSTNLTPANANGVLIGFSQETQIVTGAPNTGTGFSSDFTDATTASRVEHKTISSTTGVAATFTAQDNASHTTFGIWIQDALPTITAQPTSQTVLENNAATFNITATTSGGTLHYQWHKNGSNVGTDSSSYTTAALVITDDPAYVYCTVNDDNGSIDSNQVYARVVEAPKTPWYRA